MKASLKSVLKHSTVAKLALGGAVSAVMAMSAPAFADPGNDYRRTGFDLGRIVLNVGDRNRDYRYNDQRDSRRNYFRDSHHRDSRYRDNYRHTNPVTVRLRFDANGHGEIPLRRLLRDQHGINPGDYRIRSVNVRHKSRRHATAELCIGDGTTGRVALRKGITTLYAPRGYNSGRWVLGYDNAKVRDVAVVLDPVRNYRNEGGRHSSRRDLAFNSRVR